MNIMLFKGVTTNSSPPPHKTMKYKHVGQLQLLAVSFRHQNISQMQNNVLGFTVI